MRQFPFCLQGLQLGLWVLLIPMSDSASSDAAGIEAGKTFPKARLVGRGPMSLTTSGGLKGREAAARESPGQRETGSQRVGQGTLCEISPSPRVGSADAFLPKACGGCA